MEQIKRKFIEAYQEWGRTFWICVVLNLLAFSGYIIHLTYAVDDYGSLFSNVSHIAHGRWFAGFIYNTLLQKSYMPTLSPIIAIVCYTLTGIGLCKFWDVRGKLRWMVVALWSLHPYLLDAYNFRIATVNLAIVYLITIVALSLVPKGKRAFVLAVVVFYLALSIYQVVIGFAISVIMIQLLLQSYRNNFSSESLKEGAKTFYSYVLMLFCSLVVYAVLTKAILMAFDIQVNSRLQAGFITSFDQLFVKICWLMTMLILRLSPIKEFVLPAVGKWLIFVIIVAAVISVFKRGGKKHKALPAILWVFLIPIGAVSFMIPLANWNIPWRMCMGLVVFFAGMFALTQESCSAAIRRIAFIAGGILIAYFICSNNTMIYKQSLCNQRDMLMANRIVTKIQSLDQYQPGMELAIVGRLEKGPQFDNTEKKSWEYVRKFVKYQSEKRYSITRSAFETDLSKYSILLNYMQVDFQSSDKAGIEKARQWSIGRKSWPDPSSVFIQEDLAVVVLSPYTDEQRDI